MEKLISNDERLEDRPNVRRDHDTQAIINGKEIYIRLLKARDIYRCFIEKARPAAEIRWEREGYIFDNWSQIYDLPYKCTSSTRLQSLQFRVVHRFIPTLKFLYTRQVTENPLCPICKIQETLQHFLFYCRDVHPIWSVVLPNLKQILALSDDFVTCTTVIFGYPKGTPVINLLVLLVKQYIISRKLREPRKSLSVEGVKYGILQYFKKEEYITKYYTTLTAENFRKKWERVLDEDGNLDVNAIFH